jgi:hypothetical protein
MIKRANCRVPRSNSVSGTGEATSSIPLIRKGTQGDPGRETAHQVTRFEQQEVPAHDFGRSNHVSPPTPHHPGPRRCQARQCRNGALGALFLEKADPSVDEYYGQDGNAVYHLSECHRDQGCTDQHPNHQAAELSGEKRQG